jgi:transposase-like protein
MAVLDSGVIGTFILLACPHCHAKQACEKAGGSSVNYRCRECYKTFSRAEGEREASFWRSAARVPDGCFP